MAYPVSDSYSAASGGVIAGGRHHAQPTAVLFGDSLTDASYGLTSFYWLNGLNGGKLQLVGNYGVSGDTIANMISRVDAALSGVSVGHLVFRGGTNDARGATTIASLAAGYTTLLSKFAEHATKVIILSVPPLGGSDAGNNSKTVDYNGWLASFAAATPSVFTFVDDCAGVRDGSNAQIAAYFNVDGVHFAGAGVAQCGITGAYAFGAALSNYTSPLALLAGDVYPTAPQWFKNPTNTGSGGTVGSGFSGSAINDVSIGAYGAGFSAACSIVAADGGDANQTPWQRVSISAVPAQTMGESISITSLLAGRTITGSDPNALDVAIELRLNALDTTYIREITSWIQGSGGEKLVPDLSLKMGGASLSKTVVLRHKMPRAGSSAHSSATIYVYITSSASHTGALGSVDVRNITIRG